jgi:hypothetical protein
MNSKSICFSLLLIYSQASSAACTGTVDEIQQGYNGRVSLISHSLYGDSNARDICRLDSAWGGVAIDTCKSWLSTLLVAYSTEKNILIQYADDAACSSIGTWENAVRPHAIRLKKCK